MEGMHMRALECPRSLPTYVIARWRALVGQLPYPEIPDIIQLCRNGDDQGPLPTFARHAVRCAAMSSRSVPSRLSFVFS